MPAQSGEALSRAPIPELDALGIAATGQQLPIEAEGHRPDGARVALQGFQIACPVLPRLHAPELDGLVIAAAGQQLASGVKGHGSDPAAMAAQSAQTLPC